MNYPCEPFIISQPFGAPGQFYTDQGLLGHNGIDIAVPNGTQVRCVNKKKSRITKIIEGTVDPITNTRGKGMWCTEVEPDEQGRYLVTSYWHLQEFLKTEIDVILPGDVIALSNNTGHSSGPHLHFGAKYYKKDTQGNFYTINTNNGYQGYFDPTPLLQSMTINKDELTQLYLAVFGRLPDDGANGYIGQELLFVLSELMKSREYQAYAEVLNAIQHRFLVKV